MLEALRLVTFSVNFVVGMVYAYRIIDIYLRYRHSRLIKQHRLSVQAEIIKDRYLQS